MKGFRFYAEMPEERGSKSGSKRWGPFTRKTLANDAEHGCHVNCIAVPLGANDQPLWQAGSRMMDAIVPCDDRSNTVVTTASVQDEYLRVRCVRIDADLARRLHPNLFKFLEAPCPAP